MSGPPEDPRCPECGGKIGQTATYCMHCSADLTDEQAAADADGDETWDSAEASTGTGAEAAGTGTGAGTTAGGATGTATGGETTAGTAADEGGGHLLDPDGLVDNTLTVLVGIAGGIVVGVVGTFVLLVLTESAWALPFGLLAWLGSTGYLARRRTVTGAVASTAYAVAIVLLLVPLLAFSPGVEDSTLADRLAFFGVLLFVVAIPAAVAGGVGWLVSRFVAEPGSEG